MQFQLTLTQSITEPCNTVGACYVTRLPSVTNYHFTPGVARFCSDIYTFQATRICSAPCITCGYTIHRHCPQLAPSCFLERFSDPTLTVLSLCISHSVKERKLARIDWLSIHSWTCFVCRNSEPLSLL